jgi:trk system potassium uptake protein TrkH
MIAMTLLLTRSYDNLNDAIRDSLFHVVSIGTTTGFGTSGFSDWPTFVPVLIMFIGFFGGCSGSTAGGIKTVRALLLLKQGRREIHRIIHPNARILVKMGGRAVNERVINAVWGFFATYSILFIIMMLVLMGTGLDLLTAFSAIAATINNVGPGLGAVSTDFTQVSDLAKWVSIFAMLLGRLEVFTLLVLLTPAFWKG